ncbi:hypothetical protein V2J09_001010 [Rumex salicifolius]
MARDRDNNSDPKSPLLGGSSSNRRLSFSHRRNSVSSLRNRFTSTLPDKLRSGLDPEFPFDLDLSKTSGLTHGEKEYYEAQFATLKSFDEVDRIVQADSKEDGEEEDEEQRLAEKAMKISNYANVVLLAFKIFATVKTGSIAIAASTLDSLLDLMAGGATVVKLALFLYCRTSWNKIVRAYAKDHYFDVVTNVVGLAAALLGDAFYWWIDPVGAILLAVYTITNWSGTVMENAVSLVGQTAPPDVLQKLTYLVLRHPKVKRIDTIRAYTFGVLYFVEVDIELPEDTPLKEAHAIGETLQDKLEKLSEVERAFVHLDHECDHKPEHTIVSRLPNSD